MKPDAPAPLATEEFIRRIIPQLRVHQSLGPGVAFRRLEEVFTEQFGCSAVDTINKMLGNGSLVAAHPATHSTEYKVNGMQRPELLDTILPENCVDNYPFLYLPSELPNGVRRLWNARTRRAEAVRNALAGIGISPKGGENIIVLADTIKKK